MLVAAQKYLRDKGVIPASRYLKTDAFGTARTQERRRPARLGGVLAQRPDNRPERVESGKGGSCPCGQGRGVRGSGNRKPAGGS